MASEPSSWGSDRAIRERSLSRASEWNVVAPNQKSRFQKCAWCLHRERRSGGTREADAAAVLGAMTKAH